jgi:hypothetical protein
MRHRFSVGWKHETSIRCWPENRGIRGQEDFKVQQDVKAELGRMHRKEKKLRAESLKRFDMHPT